MLYTEILRLSREKPQVAYQEFALHTRQGKDGLFCFFEGKDNAYYVPVLTATGKGKFNTESTPKAVDRA